MPVSELYVCLALAVLFIKLSFFLGYDLGRIKCYERAPVSSVMLPMVILPGLVVHVGCMPCIYILYSACIFNFLCAVPQPF